MPAEIERIDRPVHDSVDSSVEAVRRSPVATIPINRLSILDSPRLLGLSEGYVRTLASLDTPAPPIVVHRETMNVIDGRHRVCAAERRGRESIRAQFFEGRSEDAFVLAVELNSRNALPLSRADRTTAAERIIISHPEWSDRRIAAVAGLAARTVANLRGQYCPTDDLPQLDSRVGRDGRIRPIDVGQRRETAARILAEDPQASLRSVARQSGLSPSTVADVRNRLGAEPHSVARERNTPAQRGGSPSNSAALLRQLRDDPSMQSERGRMMLRLMGLTNTLPALSESVLQFVPSHCAATVAVVARRCADAWAMFADQIDRKRA